jgi:ABC-type dipeptide/oligopeptide/nickel transport system ATPase component
VLNLLLDLRRDRQLTFVFIAHNLAVVQRMATQVVVMQKGRIVELGTTDAVVNTPQHLRSNTVVVRPEAGSGATLSSSESQAGSLRFALFCPVVASPAWSVFE